MRHGVFHIERHHRGRRLVLTVTGELDHAARDALEAATGDIPAGADVVLDLRELEFMDAAGLKALLDLDLRARDDGWTIRLANPPQAVRRLLDVTGFAGWMPIDDT